MITLIDGHPIPSDQSSFKEGEELFLPLRAVLEQMGWIVEWYPEHIETTYIAKNGNCTTSYIYFEDTEYIRMQAGEVFILASRFSKLTRAQVEHDEAADTVNIQSGDPIGVKITYSIGKQVEVKKPVTPELTPVEREEKQRRREELQMNKKRYASPPSLVKLKRLDQELRDETGRDLDDYMGLGLYFSPEEMNYDRENHDIPADETVPIDYIYFIYNQFVTFGFLTDFSSIDNLEEAPIVIHDSSDDTKAKIVAENLMDFLRILITVKSIYYIQSDNINEDLREGTSLVLNKIKDYFGIEPIKDLGAYRENLQNARQRKVAVNTTNHIGVVQVLQDTHSMEHKTITLDRYGDYEQYLSDIRSFFSQENCSVESKLACIRNIQEDCNLTAPGVAEFLIGELEQIGLINEVERLEFLVQSSPRL